MPIHSFRQACPNPLPQVGRQAGVVLPVALFILVIATLLTLGLVKANLISLRIGGASVIGAEAMAAAELKLNNFLRLNPFNSQNASSFQNEVAGDAASYFQAADAYFLDAAIPECSDADNPIGSRTQFDCRPHNAPPDPRRIACGPAPYGSGDDTGIPYYHFQVTAGAADASGLGGFARIGAGVSVRRLQQTRTGAVSPCI